MPEPHVLIAPALRRWFGVDGLALLPGVVILSEDIPAGPVRERLLRHEQIHHAQQLETGILPFYLLYGAEYLRHRLRGLGHWAAYRANAFEQEAYRHDRDAQYLHRRKPYAWAN